MTSVSASPPEPALDVSVNHDQLSGWKQIGAYLGRGPRAVQRWERDLGLPIRRIPMARRMAVYAFKGELDAWRHQRARGTNLEIPTGWATDGARDSMTHEMVATLGLVCMRLRDQLPASGNLLALRSRVVVREGSQVVRVTFSISAARDRGQPRRGRR